MSNKSFLNFCHPLYLHLFYLTNGQWFWYLLDCTDNNIGHHINQNVVKSVGCTLWLCNILTTVNVVVDKSTDHAKSLSICFFLPQYWGHIEWFFNCMIDVWYVDMSSIVCAFTVKSNSANQILTLLPIGKKISWQAPHLRSPSVMSSLALPTLPPPLQKPTLSKSQIIYLSRLGSLFWWLLCALNSKRWINFEWIFQHLHSTYLRVRKLLIQTFYNVRCVFVSNSILGGHVSCNDFIVPCFSYLFSISLYTDL